MSDRNVANSISLLMASLLGLITVTPSLGRPMCKPALAFKDVWLSEMQPPTLEWRWTAIVAVDASHCAAHSAGHFEIGFLRLKENSADIEFRERFKWRPPSVQVAVDFWADEAVEHYWFDNIAPCPCRD